MRFSDLQLIKYGKFDGATLAFPASATDFHMIVGPNEAGKSTTLSAIGDFLFGFPHQTSFDFRFDRQLLRIGATIDLDGEVVSLRRRKGNSQTLLDDQEQPVDEGCLASLLGGQSRDNFHRMFSLDHARLRRGGQAILDAEDDVGKVIFAAGSGLVGVNQLATQLDEEAKAIWTSRAKSNRAYYLAHNAAEEARQRLRAAQVRPAKWEERRRSAEALANDLEVQRQARAQAQAELQEVERRRRVLAPIAQFQRARSSLEALGEVPLLPIEAAQTVAEVKQVLAEARGRVALAERQAKTAREELSSISIVPQLIEQREAIDELRQEVGAVEKSLADLPKRRVEQRACDKRLQGLLDEIGWPQDAAAAVRDRLPGRPAVAELRQLIEALSGVETRLESAEAANRRGGDELRRIETELASLPVSRDYSVVSSALRVARAAGDLDRRVTDAEGQVAVAAKALTTALSQLSPWTGTADQLEQLSLPVPAEAGRLGVAITQSEARVSAARSELTRLRDQAAQFELQRSQIVKEGHAVSVDEISKSRERRDGIWGVIRGAVLLGGSVEDAQGSVKDFEAAKAAADAKADERFDKAELSARLLEFSKALERLTLEIMQTEVRVRAAEMDAEQAAQAWASATTFVPGITPATFESWRDRRDRALQNSEALRVAELALKGAIAERQNVGSMLQAALATVEVALMVSRSASPVSLLIDAAERSEKRAADDELKRSALQAQAATVRAGLVQLEAEQRSAGDAHAAWKTKWSKAVTTVGLDPIAEPSKIRASLEILEEIRTEIGSVLRLQERIDGMEADIHSFELRLRQLAEQCRMADATELGARLLHKIVAAADQAVRLKGRQTDLQKQIADAERTLSEERSVATVAEARLQPLWSLAQVKSDGELDLAVARSDQTRALRTRMDALAEEIVGLGDGLSLDDLLKDTESCDSIALKGQADQLSDKVNELNAAIERLSAEYNAAEAAFRELDDSPDAAVAAADLAQARSEMEFQAEAYVKKRAEASLLRWAINRYRREKQAPLLERASTLFSTLTLHRYSRLTVEMDDGAPRLSAITADGLAAVPVSGLSEGTVDQLFLSLRLAAVEEAITQGIRLPFLADDLFINFDDGRAEAGFRVLGELAAKTQVLFFTHHDHLQAVAQRALPDSKLSTYEII